MDPLTLPPEDPPIVPERPETLTLVQVWPETPPVVTEQPETSPLVGTLTASHSQVNAIFPVLCIEIKKTCPKNKLAVIFNYTWML